MPDIAKGFFRVGVPAEQFAVLIPFQKAIESLHKAVLAVGIGLGDVLHVGADKDQTAGMELAIVQTQTIAIQEPSSGVHPWHLYICRLDIHYEASSGSYMQREETLLFD